MLTRLAKGGLGSAKEGPEQLPVAQPGRAALAQVTECGARGARGCGRPRHAVQQVLQRGLQRRLFWHLAKPGRVRADAPRLAVAQPCVACAAAAVARTDAGEERLQEAACCASIGLRGVSRPALDRSRDGPAIIIHMLSSPFLIQHRRLPNLLDVQASDKQVATPCDGTSPAP